MYNAAENGHIEIVKLCREWGAKDYDEALCLAALGGHIEILRLCREYGEYEDFDSAMWFADLNGHIRRLCPCAENGFLKPFMTNCFNFIIRRNYFKSLT